MKLSYDELKARIVGAAPRILDILDRKKASMLATGIPGAGKIVLDEAMRIFVNDTLAALAQQAQPEDGTGYCQDCEMSVKGDDVVHTHCAGTYFGSKYLRSIRTRSTDNQ